MVLPEVILACDGPPISQDTQHVTPTHETSISPNSAERPSTPSLRQSISRSFGNVHKERPTNISNQTPVRISDQTKPLWLLYPNLESISLK